MATQHPDNATAPYWSKDGNPFIGTHLEITDCMASFSDMDIPEYMWDWEGKHADAAVIDKLFTKYYDYFSKLGLGKDIFLTFRLPNIWEEKGYSLLQAMSVILSSEDFARDLGFANRPLFEVILPMTERADQLMHMHTLFQKLAEFKSNEFTPSQPKNTDYLEVIPLVESVESQRGVRKLLDEYVKLHQRHFGRKPTYIRPFFARSDPALVSGLLSTVLANKLALSEAYTFSSDTGIPVFPIAGVGSLPFRGGLTPDTAVNYASSNPGIRTVSIQSAFRFDYPLAKVKAALRQLDSQLPKNKPRIYSDKVSAVLTGISEQAAQYYQQHLTGLVPDMQTIFAAVPRRRERRQHIGLLAYGRSMGKQQLPRAITFTAGFYSIGVPPEFIGLGKTLLGLSQHKLDVLQKEHSAFSTDLEQAGRFLNRDNLDVLAKRNSAWKAIKEDIAATETLLGVRFQPRTNDERAHKNLTSNVLLLKNNHQALSQLIAETAVLRKSLG